MQRDTADQPKRDDDTREMVKALSLRGEGEPELGNGRRRKREGKVRGGNFQLVLDFVDASGLLVCAFGQRVLPGNHQATMG